MLSLGGGGGCGGGVEWDGEESELEGEMVRAYEVERGSAAAQSS